MCRCFCSRRRPTPSPSRSPCNTTTRPAEPWASPIGINGGAPQPYLFDTGSALFNVLYNPATWGGGGPQPRRLDGTRGQNQFYCYGSQPCYQGNIVQMPTLSFYAAGAAAGATPAVTLSATQGYQISAVFQSVNSDTNRVTQRFPDWYQNGNPPPLYGTFYGIFGTGNFASTSTAQATPGGPQTDGPIVGGVLGQTMAPGSVTARLCRGGERPRRIGGPAKRTAFPTAGKSTAADYNQNGIGGRTMQPVITVRAPASRLD